MAEFERAVQPSPTITDAKLVSDLCQATIDVLVAFDHWRSSPEWRDGPAAAGLIDAVGAVRDSLAELPASPSLAAVLAAVTPLLDPCWPADAEPAAAVEQLRYLTLTRAPAITDPRELNS